ncbi:MAG: helix-turn-helix transcriptional regulator [Candidatus Melainabacteria bacterium]|nr:helix-turn-helix transcriptional regulator [Candidatus Melainabacteria bacterium]
MKTGNKTVRQIGKRIRELRLERRWSQQYLASLLDVEQAYISSIERGEYGPSVRRIAMIAEAFGMSLSALFDGIGPCLSDSRKH